MKKIIFSLCFGFVCFIANAQTTTQKTKTKATETQQIKNKTVEIACGECQFKMKGKSCDLAVKMDGKTYFVDGKSIDDFGDAHNEHGFCNAVSKAEVTGQIVNNRFKATEIKLLPKK